MTISYTGTVHNEKRQKQPSKGVFREMCSENMHQIYRRTHMPKCDFNKVVLQPYWNLTSAWVLSCKLLHIFSIPFPKNTCGGLLLKRACDKFCDKVSACWRVPVVHSETGNNLFHLFSIVSNLNLANSAKVLIFDKLTFFDLYLYMLKQP